MFERFWDSVEKTDGCWLWKGRINPNGYGYVSVMGKEERAHRVAFAIAVGPIPDGMDVLHECDNTRCVNPDHLFPGTHQDNMTDMWTKGRGKLPLDGDTIGEKNGYAKLSSSEVNALRIEYGKGNATQRELGRKYGISQAQVGRIVRRENWQVSA